MCLGAQNGTIEIKFNAETDTFIPIADQGSYAWDFEEWSLLQETKSIVIFTKLWTNQSINQSISEIFKNPVQTNHLYWLL